MIKYMKRIILVAGIMLIFFSIDVHAASEGDIISFDGITTKMPAVSIANKNDEEDPEYLKNISNENDFFIQKGDVKLDPEVGSSNAPDEHISELISRFSTNTAVVGIDISAHQGDINWQEVANSGVKFAMIRCGFRGYGDAGTLKKDEYFDQNIQGALNYGIHVGVYFYSTALNEQEALQEAELTYECIKNYKLTYPVSYDFEEFGMNRTTNLSNEQMHRNAKLFMNYIKSKGYNVSLYSSASPLKDTWKMNEMSEYDVWVAHYYVSKPNYNGTYQMWQYTNNAVVPGISTRVDVDVDYGYWSGIKILASLKPYIKNKGWNLINNDWFYLTNDEAIAIGWKFINNKWYYFDVNTGLMASNCVQDSDGKMYLLSSSGAMISTAGWHYINNNWYYINPNSTVYTGWIFYKNIWYYLYPENGTMATRPVNDNGIIYCVNENGEWIQPKGWYKVEKDSKVDWYYFENGIGVIGWRRLDDGDWYYLDNGIMARGWRKINNIWYYLEVNGKMVENNYVVMGNYTYCFDSSGAMVSNRWFYCNGKWLFLNKDGAALKGWQFINKKWYYFDNDGIMFNGTELTLGNETHLFDTSGAWIRSK